MRSEYRQNFYLRAEHLIRSAVRQHRFKVMKRRSVIVVRLVCLGHIVTPHRDFRKAPQPTPFQPLVQVTQHQIQQLLDCLLTTEYLHHLRSTLHFLAPALQLVCGIEVSPYGLGMTQEGQERISLGFPVGHHPRIDRSPTLLEFPEHFFRLSFCFRPIHGFQILGQGLPVVPPRLVEGIAYGVKPTKPPIRLGEDFSDRLL